MAAIKLPTGKIEPSRFVPRMVFLYGREKIGKTTALTLLPEPYIILDTEKGASHTYSCRYEVNNYGELRDVCMEINKSGKPYKYVAIDTTTGLETFAIQYAAYLYKKSPFGANWAGTGASVLGLPHGQGYGFLREALNKMLSWISSTVDDKGTVILSGHLRPKVITKDEQSTLVEEIDLTGKNRSIVTAMVDMLGYLYRKDGNLWVSTVRRETEDVISAARYPWLDARQEILVEKTPEGLKAHWEKLLNPQ